MRIYSVFYISLLKKVNQNIILVKIKIKDKTEYKIK
jgi:hypothetical protein